MCGMILYHNDLYSLSCVFFLPLGLRKGIKKNPTKLIEYKSYTTTNHERFFLSHIFVNFLFSYISCWKEEKVPYKTNKKLF